MVTATTFLTLKVYIIDESLSCSSVINKIYKWYFNTNDKKRKASMRGYRTTNLSHTHVIKKTL